MPNYKTARDLRPGDRIIVRNHRRQYQAIVQSTKHVRGQVQIQGRVSDRHQTPVQFALAIHAEVPLV